MDSDDEWPAPPVLPRAFHCGACPHWTWLPEPPELLPACPECGRIMRAAWERDPPEDEA